MFIQLKNDTHIDTSKVMSITLNGDKYSLKMANGLLIEVTIEEFPWLVKICGFMIELKSKSVINMRAIETVSVVNDKASISLMDGSIFEITPEEASLLMSECKCMNLEQRILFLQGKNIPCEDYKKL